MLIKIDIIMETNVVLFILITLFTMLLVSLFVIYMRTDSLRKSVHDVLDSLHRLPEMMNELRALTESLTADPITRKLNSIEANLSSRLAKTTDPMTRTLNAMEENLSSRLVKTTDPITHRLSVMEANLSSRITKTADPITHTLTAVEANLSSEPRNADAINELRHDLLDENDGAVLKLLKLTERVRQFMLRHMKSKDLVTYTTVDANSDLNWQSLVEQLKSTESNITKSIENLLVSLVTSAQEFAKMYSVEKVEKILRDVEYIRDRMSNGAIAP